MFSIFSEWSPPSVRSKIEVYRNQPRSIIDYEPGFSSIAFQESKSVSMHVHRIWEIKTIWDNSSPFTVWGINAWFCLVTCWCVHVHLANGPRTKLAAACYLPSINTLRINKHVKQVTGACYNFRDMLEIFVIKIFK